jgi:hypothetical protein
VHVSALRKALIGFGVIFAILIAAFVVKAVVRYIDRPSDEVRVERAIEGYYLSTDPQVCEYRASDAYLEQVYGEPEPFARATCELSSSEGVAGGVDVSGVAVDGDWATAQVRFDGSSLDGSTVKVRLVHADDYWRLDQLLAFVHFDRAAGRRAYRNALLEFGSPRTAATCVAAAERRFSDTELERILLTDPRQTFTPIVVRCDRAGVERNAISTVAAAAPDLTGKQLDCVERRLRSAGQGELTKLTIEIPAYIALLEDCVPGYLGDYTRRELTEHDKPAATVSCVVARVEGLPLDQATRVLYDRDRYRALIDNCAPA